MNTKIVKKYFFHDKTDFTYGGFVEISMEEDDEDYNLKSNQTLVSPPETKENEICVWNQSKCDWDIVPDFRFSPVYYTANGDFLQYSSVGELPNHLTEKSKPDSYYTWSTKKKDWVIDENLSLEYSIQTKLQDRLQKFNQVDWIVWRHLEETSLKIPTTITNDKYKEIVEYKQYLRDITEDKNWPDVEIKDPPPL